MVNHTDMTGQGMEDNLDAGAGEQIPAEKIGNRIMEVEHGSGSLMFHFISHA